MASSPIPARGEGGTSLGAKHAAICMRQVFTGLWGGEGREGRDPPGAESWTGRALTWSPGPPGPVPIEPQICQATCAVMKLSFDEEYRRAMNELGECPLALPTCLPPNPVAQGSGPHSALGRPQKTGGWLGSQGQRGEVRRSTQNPSFRNLPKL